MGTEQETLIYIEDKDKLDASVTANAFAHKDVKNRVYINTLGAELALKYLASEDIDVSNIHNIHSIKKILEELDISDIMLPNIHIDVRVVFDENAIFIPKSHFEYNLVPDIYLVFHLAKDLSHVKFLGFFDPKLINKNNANDQYYFIEKEKLSSAKDLKKYIEEHNGSTNENLADEDVSNSERIIMAMSDNDISEEDKKYLINQLTKSADLRDKFIEYENFETLSYKAMTSSEIKKPEVKSPVEEVNSDAVVDSAVEEIPEDVTENLEIGNVELEQLEPIEDISLDEFTETENSKEEVSSVNNDKTSSSALADIAGATIAGAVAGTVAGAGAMAVGEVAGAVSAVSGVEAVTDAGIDLASAGLDVAKNLVTGASEETISFDNVDLPAVEDVAQPVENTQLETISLDNVELPVDESQADFLNSAEETISFDNVEDLNKPEMDTVAEPLDFENDKISLDDVDTSVIEPLSEDINLNENNMMSFDDVDVDNLDTTSVQPAETADADSLSLENIDSIDLPEDENLTLDSIDDTISLEEDNLNEAVEAPQAKVEQTVEENIEPEIVEDETDGFGTNLLENLNSVNLDNVSIEDLDLGDDNASNSDIEDVSSSELLSQIDDVLNSSTLAETPVSSAENTPSSLDEIPEISDFGSTKEQEVNNSIDELLDGNDVEGSADSNNGETNSAIAGDLDELLGDVDADSAENYQEAETKDNEANQGEDKSIDVLFNDTDPVSDAELDNLESLPSQNIPGGALIKEKPKAGKNKILVTATLVTVLAAASAITFLKPKQDNAADILDPVVPKTSPAPESVTSDNNDSENILATNAPDIKKDAMATVQKAPQNKELKNTPIKPKQGAKESYMEVSKLVWDVPDSLSYSPKMQNYLRTTGKSIKLSLSADLLLADEYAYTNQVKVSLKLGKDGAIQDSRIVSSSGSNQIDKIVLQSVKETLSVVKPPSDEIKSPDFNLALIIYF